MNGAHATNAVHAGSAANAVHPASAAPAVAPAHAGGRLPAGPRAVRPARTAGPAGLAGPAPSAATRDADGMAVASFLLGLPGLLVMNVVLGPAAVVLALVALARGTARRGRALLGLALGAADLAVFAALTVAAHGVLWSFS